jgi:hypothetical protein
MGRSPICKTPLAESVDRQRKSPTERPNWRDTMYRSHWPDSRRSSEAGRQALLSMGYRPAGVDNAAIERRRHEARAARATTGSGTTRRADGRATSRSYPPGQAARLLNRGAWRLTAHRGAPRQIGSGRSGGRRRVPTRPGRRRCGRWALVQRPDTRRRRPGTWTRRRRR